MLPTSALTSLLDLHQVLLSTVAELRLTGAALLRRLAEVEVERDGLAVRCRRLEDELARRGVSEVEIARAAGDIPLEDA